MESIQPKAANAGSFARESDPVKAILPNDDGFRSAASFSNITSEVAVVWRPGEEKDSVTKVSYTVEGGVRRPQIDGLLSLLRTYKPDVNVYILLSRPPSNDPNDATLSFVFSNTPISSELRRVDAPKKLLWGYERPMGNKAGVDLIGIEPNPGPTIVEIVEKPKSKGKNKGKKKPKSKQQQGRGANHLAVYEPKAKPGIMSKIPRFNSNSHLLAYMRCLNDPFNSPPCRSGVGTALPTGVWTAYARVPTATNGSGQASYVFYPGRLTNMMLSSGSTGAPYTWASFNTPPQVAAAAILYERFRVTAAGIRVFPTQASTADSGVISMGLIPSLNSAANAQQFGIITGGGNYGYVEYPTYAEVSVAPFKQGMTCFWRPQDPISFSFGGYSGYSFAGGTFDNIFAIPFIVVGLSGCSASAAFDIEFIAHYESTITSGNAGVVSLQRAPATSDASALAASDKVFGATNRTAIPGTSRSFSASQGTNTSSSLSGLGKLAWDFGSSMLPGIVEALL